MTTIESWEVVAQARGFVSALTSGLSTHRSLFHFVNEADAFVHPPRGVQAKIQRSIKTIV